MNAVSRRPIAPALAVASLAVLAACSQRADHERMGDRRYAEHAWSDAQAEYRLAARQRRPSLELRAKLAAAALHAGDLSGSAAAWLELAQADGSARGEAAEGLVRTARAAIAARDLGGLRAAVRALEDVSPDRLIGLGAALASALEPERRASDAAALLRAAALAPAQADSLMTAWADLSARAGRCDQAMRGFESVLRRGVGTALQRTARAGLAACRVDSGRLALSAGDLEQAEALFRQATGAGVPDSTVRLAWLLIGDVRWASGDSVVAAEAYRKAAANGDETNPLVLRALEQLHKLEGGTPPQP